MDNPVDSVTAAFAFDRSFASPWIRAQRNGVDFPMDAVAGARRTPGRLKTGGVPPKPPATIFLSLWPSVFWDFDRCSGRCGVIFLRAVAAAVSSSTSLRRQTSRRQHHVCLGKLSADQLGLLTTVTVLSQRKALKELGQLMRLGLLVTKWPAEAVSLEGLEPAKDQSTHAVKRVTSRAAGYDCVINATVREGRV